MPTLRLTESGSTIGEISGEQLEFLSELLVGEDANDRDYYINKDTLEMLQDEGCDPALLELLKKALGDKEDIDVSWEP